jgi:hypothetical protein
MVNKFENRPLLPNGTATIKLRDFVGADKNEVVLVFHKQAAGAKSTSAPAAFRKKIPNTESYLLTTNGFENVPVSCCTRTM